MKEDKFDAGPLQVFKKGFDLEKIKKNISIDTIHIQTLIKTIKKDRYMQRFAVSWGADGSQKLKIVLGATLPPSATLKEIEELTDACGHAIVAKKDLLGVVHQKLKKKFPVPDLYVGGLSFFLYLNCKETGKYDLIFVVSDRSTDQYESQDYNKIAEMSDFYNFSPGDGTIYDREKIQFTRRKRNETFKKERSSMRPITELIFDTICAHIKDCKEVQINKVTVNYSDCYALEYHQTWEKEFRYNKDKIADFLLTTICVACGYNDNEKPDRFWPIPDEEIVFEAMQVAEDADIKLDLNKIPNRLKEVCGQDDFSTTALIFAAKKTDIDPRSRLKLVLYLIQNGADPAVKDKNGCDALWYARQAGNVEIAEHLSMLAYHRSAPLVRNKQDDFKIALETKNIDDVREILTDAPSLFNEKFENGKFPIDLVAESKSPCPDLINLLFRLGVKFPLEDEEFLKHIREHKDTRDQYKLFINAEAQRFIKLCGILAERFSSFSIVFKPDKWKSTQAYKEQKRILQASETVFNQEGRAEVKEFKIGDYYKKILSVDSSAARQLLLIDYIELIYQENFFDLSDHEEKQNFSLHKAQEVIFEYLKKLAQDKKWETQGKGVIFFPRHTPKGVNFMISDKCNNYQKIIKEIHERLNSNGFWKSDQTYGLYELIMAIDEFVQRKNDNDFLKNHPAFIQTIQKVIEVFCETWFLTPINFDSQINLSFSLLL